MGEGWESEEGRGREKNQDNFLPPFSLNVTWWSICRSFGVYRYWHRLLVSLLERNTINAIVVSTQPSSLYVFVTDFLNISESTWKLTLKSSLFLEHWWIRSFLKIFFLILGCAGSSSLCGAFSSCGEWELLCGGVPPSPVCLLLL